MRGTPHISYIIKDSILKYAWFDGTRWHIETVQTNSIGLLYPSLVLDGSDSPRLVYVSRYRMLTDYGYDYYSQVVYARRITTSWQTTVVAEYLTGTESPDVGGHSSLVLDGNGFPHISFYDGTLMYAWYDGTRWQSTSVSSEPGKNTSLVIDSLGQPHISYSTIAGVKHAWREGTSWRIETVDATAANATTSLAVYKPSGYLHIGYYSENYLKHAWFDGTDWQTEFVDTDLQGSLGGQYHSLALDQADLPHLAYYTPIVLPYAEARLEYISYAGTTSSSILWRTETIDSGHTGTYPSLVLDETDHPHVSYCDYSKPMGGLKYAWHNGTQWQLEWVDRWRTDAPEPCKFTTLVLDNLDHPHISYVNGVDGAVKYAWHDGSTWHVETVTNIITASMPGKMVSMALDGTGTPHLVFDNGTGIIRHAQRSGSFWQIETLEPNAVPGRGVTLAIDQINYPHVSYVTETSLKYARYDGTGWQSEEIDSNGDFFHPVLALDSVGQPHVVYYIQPPYYPDIGVRWSWRDGTDWHIQGRPSAVGVKSISLVLDRYDLPRFSYFERWGGQYPGLLYWYPVLPDPPFINLEIEPHGGVINGETLTYRATVYGPFLEDLRLRVLLPDSVEYVENSVTPPAVYSPTLKAVIWQGQTDIVTPTVIQFQGIVSTTYTGEEVVLPFTNTAQLTDDYDRTVYSIAIVNPYLFYLPLLVR